MSSARARSAVWRAVCVGMVVAWCSSTAAQPPVPPLAGRVVDLTGTLSGDVRTGLEDKLAAFEARKGSQIAVLVVASTAPESIEAYALRVVEAWQLGRQGVDDGVLLLVALDDRRMRFEVGYGLEGSVPDALARRIIAETIAPRFYEGDYAGGLTAGLDALIGLIDGEPLPVPIAAEPEFEPFAALPFILFFAVVVAPILKRVFGNLPGAAVLGAGAGVVVWLVSSVLVASVFVGFIVFVVALAGVGGGPGRWSSGGPGRHWGGGGFGGRGGGFRGGGGRFGGGGASGGW